MHRFAVPVLAIVAAVMAAVTIAIVAHVGLGVPRATIRVDAIAGVAFVGVAMATRIFLKRNG
jgi:hypothetical protein